METYIRQESGISGLRQRSPSNINLFKFRHKLEILRLVLFLLNQRLRFLLLLNVDFIEPTLMGRSAEPPEPVFLLPACSPEQKDSG